MQHAFEAFWTELLSAFQVSPLNDCLGDGAALYDLVLGMIKITPGSIHGHHLLERDYVGILFLDEEQSCRTIDWLHGKGENGRYCDDHNQREYDQPLPLPQNPEVVPQMYLRHRL